MSSKKSGQAQWPGARGITTHVAIWVSLIAGNALAQNIVPSALLTIDQNRTTVVDRVVSQWGEPLARSSAGLSSAQLREVLNGLRADHLLAASLAGSVEGLRDVVSGALAHTDAAVSPGLLHTKSLGDAGDDLVYTPAVPCRILDTRNGTIAPYNSVMIGGAAFPVAANLANFAPQGGSATNCNLPASFAAIAVTLTVLNPNFDAFLAASSSSNFATLSQAVVMDFSANKGLANTAIVPVDGTVKFYLGLPAQVTTHVIADAVGYFRSPNGNGGLFFKQFGNAFGSAAVLGTLDNSAVDVLADGARVMHYQPTTTSPNLLGGHPNNVVLGAQPGQTIAGGGDGVSNCYEPSNGTDTRNCRNQSDADFTTIGGGNANHVNNSGGTVAGGQSNTATTNATVGGGLRNTASGGFAAVGGVLVNTASANSSIVAGGAFNTASSLNSVVLGGQHNTASGSSSFAGGNYASADADFCFVFSAWSFEATPHLSCSGLASFMRLGFHHGLEIDYLQPDASGGGQRSVYIGDAIGGKTITAWNGAYLSDAGVWTNNSDANHKTAFAGINPREVLARVASLPITSWRYRGEDPSKRHIGPMAQDFWMAFGLGDDDKHIGTIDESGVALAAIKGLHQTVRQQMRSKDKEIAELKRKLRAIEAKLGL